MTLKSFFFITLLQWAAMLLLRFFYFKGNFGEGNIEYYIYFFLIAFFTLVLVRRVGTINFLEAIFICFFWFCAFVFLDLIVTSAFLGVDIFKNWGFWVGYLIMVLVAFLFHKKRHVQIRKEQHKHGHH